MTHIALTTEERPQRAQSSLALVEQLHRLVLARDVEGFSPTAASAVARLAHEGAADIEWVLFTLSGAALNTDAAPLRSRRPR